MNTRFILSLRSGLGLLAAVCAFTVAKADENKPKDKPVAPNVLKKYDTNKDGVLDEKEKAVWEADKAVAAKKRLEKYDVNKNGKLDPEELATEKAEKAERQAAMEKKKAEAEKKKAEAGKTAGGGDTGM